APQAAGKSRESSKKLPVSPAAYVTFPIRRMKSRTGGSCLVERPVGREAGSAPFRARILQSRPEKVNAAEGKMTRPRTNAACGGLTGRVGFAPRLPRPGPAR